MEHINNTQLAILEALGRFQYLTTQQMIDWGVTRNKRHLYAVLQTMEGKPSSPVRKMNFGAIAGIGRLHSIYHLTRYGVEILQYADCDRIQYPNKPVVFTRDYFHRVGSIDLHIAFEKWAKENGGSIEKFDTYYDRTGRSLRGFPAPKTTIKWHDNQITPDAICLLLGSDTLPRLCAIELHRGRDMLRLDKQIIQYSKAIELDAIENAYDYKQAGRVLLVFEDEIALETCKRRVLGLGLNDNVLSRLFLNTSENVKADLVANWQTIQGEIRQLF